MDWFLLAIISFVTTALSNIMQRVVMRDENSDPYVYGFMYQMFAALVVGAFAFWNGFSFPPLNQVGFLLVITGVTYAGFAIFIFKAVQKAPASEVTLVMTTRILWTIAGAMLLLGELLNLTKIIGILCIVAAIIFLFYDGKKIKLTEGIKYALLAAAFFGLGFVNDALILQKSEVFSYTALAFFIPGLLFLVYKPSIIPSLTIFKDPIISLKVFLLGLFQGIAALTIYMAYQKGGSVSVLSPMSLSVVILTILLSALFLGERENIFKKIIAALLVTLGVYFLR